MGNSQLVNYPTWKLLLFFGVLCILLAAMVPFVDLFTSEYQSEYTYNISDRDNACDLSLEDEMDANESTQNQLDYYFNYSNLSQVAKTHVARAKKSGEYIVYNESDTASEFVFPDDGSGQGAGCYIIGYNNTDYQLHTFVDQVRSDQNDIMVAQTLGPLLLVTGVVSILLSFLFGKPSE